VNKFGSILAIDLGQSGSRVLTPAGDKNWLPNFYEPKTDILLKIEELFQKIEKAQVENVYLSLTGLNGKVHSVAQIGELAKKYTNCKTVAVCDDGLAWNLGALNGADGAIIAAGGGAVAVGRNRDEFSHIDGKGFELGDQGSAYWIGLKGLRFAIKSLEGRAENTKIIELAQDHFGNLLELPHRKLTANELHTECIQLAEKIFLLIEHDKVATSILEEAATELALSALAAAEQVELTDKKITAVGGLFKNDWFAQKFREKVLNNDPHAEVVDSLGDAIDGLLLLPQELAGKNNKLLGWWQI
jgi:glucosamine kinase